MHRSIVMASLLAVAVCTGSPVGAAPAAHRAKAKKLFEKGELYYQQGEFSKALDFYKRAHKTYRHPAFIFNIAQCHRQLKQYAKALFFYRLFLSERPRATNRVEVRRRIADMERKVKEQAARRQQVGRVSILSQPEGAAVRVDKFSGPPAGTTPVILKLSAGEHLVLFEKPGYQKVHRTVTVKAGRIAMLTVKLKLKPKSASAAVEPRRATPRRVTPRRVTPRRVTPRRAVTGDTGGPAPKKAYKPVWKRWWLWTGVAVSVVSIVLGSVAGAAALKEHRSYMDTGDQSNRDAATSNAAIADGLIFGGAALGVATIVAAIVVALKSPKKPADRDSAVGVTPACGAKGCGVWVQGRF